MAVLAIVLSAGFVAAAGPAAAAPSDDEQTFVQLINQLRDSQGVAPLTVHSELTAGARSWSDSMATADALAHSPNMAEGVSAQWTVLGENVGVHVLHNVEQLFQAFVDSPSHYQNLVDPRFQHVGVGVTYADNGKLWTTHRFMAAESAPAPSPTPTTEPPPTTAAPPPTTTPPTTTPPTTAAPTSAAPSTPPTTTASPVGGPAGDEPPTAPPSTAPPQTTPPQTTPPQPTAPTSPPTTSIPQTTPRPVDNSTASTAPTASIPTSATVEQQRRAEEMSELVQPDAEIIEDVLVDLLLAGI